MREPDADDPRPTARRRLAQLRSPKQGRVVLEGLEGGASDAPDLSRERIRTSVEALEKVLAKQVVENPATPLGREAAEHMRTLGERALVKLADDGDEAVLTPEEEIGLEAVVNTDGTRPSIPVRDGDIDAKDEKLGDWAAYLGLKRDAIRAAIASTGRLIRGDDLGETNVYGTAWMIAPGYAVTAQHVVEGLFTKIGGQWVARFGAPITLDLHVEEGAPPDPSARIAVEAVFQASPDMINNTLNLANLDAAILKLGADGPPPLTASTTLTPPVGEPRIHVIGHPKRPNLPTDDVAPAESLRMTTAVLALVFGDGFGIKRWSPGLIDVGPSTLPGDINGRVMAHDCSTLEGNSGSPVLDLSAIFDRVLGVHYGGKFKRENYAHPTANIRDHLAAAPGSRFV